MRLHHRGRDAVRTMAANPQGTTPGAVWVVVIVGLMTAGCHVVVGHAARAAFDASEGWPRKVAVLVGALVLVALVKWASEEGRDEAQEPFDEEDEGEDADQDERP